MNPELPINVLLVDDNPANLTALEAILDGLGLNLVRAASGEEALRALMEREFALVLSDVTMPSMDGFDLATLIQEREKTCSTPIIFLTATDPQEAKRMHGYRTGAVDYLIKPINPEILRAKVQVFAKLHRQAIAIQEQSAQLMDVNERLSAETARREAAEATLRRALTSVEVQVQERTAELQLILDSVPAVVFYKDREGRFLRVNRELARLVGVPPEHFVGKTDAEMGSPHGERYREDDLRVMTTGEPIRHREEQLHTAAGPRWLLTDKVPHRDESGRITGVIGFAVDITERKRAEEALRESEARQRAFADLTSDYLYIIRIDPEGKPVLEWTSDSFPRISGYSVAEIESRGGLFSIVHPDDLHISQGNFERLKKGETVVSEARAVKKSGDIFYIRNYSRPVLDASQKRLIRIIGAGQDITARKEMEAALRVSESRHRRLIESNIIGVMIANMDGRISEANDLLLNLVGYTREELQAGRVRWDALTPPEWNAADLRALEELKSTGVCTPYEKEYFHKDGHRVPIFIAVAMLEGTPGDGISLIEDLTPRKRADAVLRESERNLTEAQRIAHVGSWSWNLTGPVQWTDELYRIYGVSPETFTPTVESFFDLVYPEDRPAMREWMRACGAGECPAEFEFRAVLPDGTVRFISGRGELVRDAGGRPLQMVGTALDITARKQAETALRESETRFRTLSTLAPVGIFQTDAQGDCQFVNDRWRELAGLSAEQASGRGWIKALHPEDRERVLREWYEAAQVGKEFNSDYRFQTPAGPVNWISGNATTLLNETGQLIGYLGTITDITERKQAEQKLAESSRQLRALLARLQRAREEERIRVSREIHDELGQLLTGLKMDVRWLERKLSEPDLPATLNPLLNRAVQASELADATIASVQKIAAQLRPSALEKIGLSSALAQEARRFQDRSGVVCTVSVSEPWLEPPPEIANELFYICQEALTNVARHAHATRVEIALRTEGGDIVLDVRDDGVGMAEAELNAPRSLGLIGMRERAIQCGGMIAFERNEPRGTRVVVRVKGVTGGE